MSVSHVGCVPYWIDIKTSSHPSCTNFSQLYDVYGERDGYIDTYEHLMALGPHDLWKESQCPPPCDFIEYEVNY